MKKAGLARTSLVSMILIGAECVAIFAGASKIVSPIIEEKKIQSEKAAEQEENQRKIEEAKNYDCWLEDDELSFVESLKAEYRIDGVEVEWIQVKNNEQSPEYPEYPFIYFIVRECDGENEWHVKSNYISNGPNLLPDLYADVLNFKINDNPTDLQLCEYFFGGAVYYSNLLNLNNDSTEDANIEDEAIDDMYTEEADSDSQYNEIIYSDQEIIQMASDYYYNKNGIVPPFVRIDSYDRDIVVIHFYEALSDHDVTWDWYYVNRNTGETTNIMGEAFNIFK